MPELPEVETTCRALQILCNQKIQKVTIRQPRLRTIIPVDISALETRHIQSVTRHAKYLVFHCESCKALVHLGMSGSLRIVDTDSAWRKHDHWEWQFTDTALRYHDPRRFGSLNWFKAETLNHLGIDPLDDAFDGMYLYKISRPRSVAIKSLIMNQHIVTGVGNIYANEALFEAKIHPKTPAKNLSKQHCVTLVESIKQILNLAIEKGGSTLKDFVNPDGNTGYFSQNLKVYGRKNNNCIHCSAPIEAIIINQRNSFYCPNCQPFFRYAH